MPKRPLNSNDPAAMRRFNERLLEITKRVFSAGISGDRDSDRMGLMACVFTRKQADHLKSILILTAGGQHRDSMLVARTMIEGLALLVWASNSPSDRPSLWYEYIYLADWRLLKELASQGEAIDPDVQAKVDTFLANNGARYHSHETRKRLNASRSLQQDPYRKEWYDVDIASICRDLKGEYLYDAIYRDSSDWTHWNTETMLRALDFTGEKVTYLEDDPLRAFNALFAGFQSLFQSLEIMNQHFSLDLEDELKQLYQERNQYWEATVL